MSSTAGFEPMSKADACISAAAYDASFTRQYCLGKSSRANYFCLTTLDIPDRSL